MKFNQTYIKIISVLIFSLFVCYLIKKIVRKLFHVKSGILNEKRKNTVINLISNILRIIVLFIAFTIILEELGIDTKSFIASLGVFSLVIGLALQDLLKDIIAGFSIVFEGLFGIGDWVSIDSFKGKVISSTLRTTKIRAYTGETKIIANRNITNLINYSMDDAISLVDVEVSYETKLEKLDDVIKTICDEFKEEKGVKDVALLGLDEFLENGIKFRLMFKSDYDSSIPLVRKLKRKVIETFNKNQISIPYKQVVIHNAKL